LAVQKGHVLGSAGIAILSHHVQVKQTGAGLSWVKRGRGHKTWPRLPPNKRKNSLPFLDVLFFFSPPVSMRFMQEF